MKTIITISILLLSGLIFAQTDNSFNISGKISCKFNNKALSNCQLSLIQSNGEIIHKNSDSLGGFVFTQISCSEQKFILSIVRQYYFSRNIEFSQTKDCKDTIINVNIDPAVILIDYLPEIAFLKNKTTPELGYLDSLNIIIRILKENPNIKMDIIAYQDITENISCQKGRTEFVRSKLVEAGILGDRLKVIISDTCNMERQSKIYSAPELQGIIPYLSEEYLRSIKDSSKQEKLRTRNRCVGFDIK